MNIRNLKKLSVCSVSRPRRKPEDLKVNNNLAVTPTQMLNMAKQGVPISSQNEENFYDGDTNASWTIAPEKLKRVDPADLWQMSMTAKQKIRNAKRTKIEE